MRFDHLINPSRLTVARFYNVLLVLMSVTLVYSEYRNGYIYMVVVYVASMVLGPVSIVTSYRYERLQNFPAYVAVGITFVFFVVGSFTQLDSTAHLIWIPVSPILFFYLTNLRIGLVLTVISCFVLVAGYGSFEYLMNKPSVSLDDFYQAITAYFLTSALAYFYEADRDRQEHILFKQSEYDFLTEVLNRRGLGRILDGMVSQFERYGTQFSIILFDLDNFKLVNDQHGHVVGDRVLIELVGLVEKEIRSVDILGRWGGEEFLVIVNTTSVTSASVLAEKIRKMIEQHEFKTVKKLTSSFGVTGVVKGDDIETLFSRADMAMYDAKKNKNTVSVYANHDGLTGQ